MPQTNSIAGLLIFQTNSQGLVTEGSIPAFGNLDTTASIYAVGCVLSDASTGVQYVNTGTVLAPKWTQISQKGGSFSQTMVGAFTAPLFGSSPVGFSGTITGVRIVNGDASKGTLIFSKNGVNFCTLVKNGTAGAMTGSPLGTATGNGSPLGSVTFGPTDVMSVQNVGTDFAEVIVDFI